MDFTTEGAKPAIVVHYLPVIDRILLPEPLDPLWTMLFLAAFLAAVVATVRRPSYGIFLLVCAQPFPLDHYLFDTTVTFPKVVLLGVAIGLWQVGWKAALRERPVRNILIALLAVALVVAATIAVAAHRDAAIRETFKWIEYAALFAVVCVAYRRDPNDRLLLYGWAGVTLAVSLLALLQEGIGAPSALVVNGAIVPRIAGPLDGPNQLAAYYEIALAALCAWYVRDRFVAVTIVVALCALALTFSRGGIAGTAIALGIVFAVRADARRALMLPLATGALLGAACVGIWDVLAHVAAKALPGATSNRYAGGVGYRSELWRAAIALWRRHPLLGIGAGNYELELPHVGLLGVRTHANSWYLQALAEGGIALFLATIALVLTLLRCLATKLREAAPWQIAALAASLAVVLHQVVDYLVFYPEVAGPWWILVALGASSIRRSSPKPT